MTAAGVTTGIVCGALPILVAVWLERVVHRAGGDRRPAAALLAALAVAGAASGAAVVGAERAALRWLDWSIEASPGTSLSAFLAIAALATPLEEATKVVVVWPAVLARRLTGPRLGMLFAVFAAAGFAAASTAMFVASAPVTFVRVLRVLAAFPAHLFAAGVWGYALGHRVLKRGRLFGVAWVGAVLFRGLYDHIVFGRGPGMLAVALPMLVAMALVTWSALADIAPGEASLRVPLHLPEPPSLGEMRRALRRADQPLALRWILLGALVNVGGVVVCLAAGVFAARRLGIDLSLADEADMRSNGPLALLGASVLAAFPIVGYLLARASSAHSVLEPAFAAALAIGGAVLLLALTAPTAVVVALAFAPVAFALSCGGAWFGMDR